VAEAEAGDLTGPGYPFLHAGYVVTPGGEHREALAQRGLVQTVCWLVDTHGSRLPVQRVAATALLLLAGTVRARPWLPVQLATVAALLDGAEIQVRQP